MEKIIVLGIGNQLMMDDGVGIFLVEELIKHNWLENKNIEYLIGESDIDYCLEKIEGVTCLLIIDAVISGKKPGQISLYPLATLQDYQLLNISSHNLHLFQVLYQMKIKKGYIIGVEPYELKFHLGLSQPLKTNWNLLIEEIKKNIEELILR